MFSECALSQIANSIYETPVFHKLSNDDGLSQGSIHTIAQDDQGFMWFGTNDGLNRYDGYDFKIYRNIFSDSTTISSNLIFKIVVDRGGILWIGTDKGLNRFNPAIGEFELITNSVLNNSISITDLALSDDGKIWIGTKNVGLGCLDLESGEYQGFFYNPNIENSIPDNSILKLIVASNNTLWVGFQNGDICFRKPSDKEFSILDLNLNETEKSLNIISGFQEDKNHNLWIATNGRSLLHLNTRTLQLVQLNKSRTYETRIPYILPALLGLNDSLIVLGTDMNGLALYNTKTKQVRYYNEGESKYNVSYRTIKTLFLDRDNNLWIGTNGKGLNILSENTPNFTTITSSTSNNTALQFSSVRSIFEENNSTLWVGGYAGLQKINLTKKQTEDFYYLIPYTLCLDKADSNILWIGTEGSGIYFLNKSLQTLTQIPQWKHLTCTNNNKPKGGGGIIYKIVNLDDENLLIGANPGIYIFNKSTLSYKYFDRFAGDQSEFIDDVNNIYFDSESRIWISTMSGILGQFHPENETLTAITINNNDNAVYNNINCLFEDSSKRFWLGTNSGLILLDSNKNVSKVYDKSYGLPNNVVYGILEDENGRLWISTNLGITQFDPKTEYVTTFEKSDGLPSNEFNSAAYFQNNKNTLYFGGVNGLVIINPKKIKSTPKPNQVVITKAIIIGNKTKYDYTVAYNNKIVLTPDQNVITLGFSSMKYFSPDKSSYSFMLDNKSTEWANLDDKRNLTLTSLSPGKHELAIKSGSSTDEWTPQPTTIHIIVLPKFYQTTLFKLVVLILIISVVTAFYFFRINLIKQQQMKLEKIVDHRTEELKQTNIELETANSAKNKFLSIIAHDLKSPFNSMIGFGDILIEDWHTLDETEKIEIITLVKNTTEDTYQLLVNLLEWSRIQEKHLEFYPVQVNLFQLVNDCYKQFKGEAFLKNIRIINDVPKSISVFADTNMLHSVLRNLISNAIKFTPKNGRIDITAEAKDQVIKCCVKDSGVGMTNEDAEKLFKLQYKNSSKGTEGETGTGLGLVLCHEFIKKHNGSFSVQSELDHGSTFCFSLPIPDEKQGEETGSGTTNASLKGS